MTKIVSKISELKKPCEEVDIEEGLQLADSLLDILEQRRDGIGLAANQIGIQKQVCVTAIPKDDGEPEIWARRFINPTVIEKSEPVIFDGEGCLSFSNQRVKTLRYHSCTVADSLNPDGLKLTGLEAICAQHEIDHLHGLTMHDRRFKSYSPNNKCPCESGTKFKKCCMKKLVETREGGSMRTFTINKTI